MFPVGDWQFWVVTLVALAGLWFVGRSLVPKRRSKRTSLTVGGQPPRRKGSGTLKGPGGPTCH